MEVEALQAQRQQLMEVSEAGGMAVHDISTCGCRWWDLLHWLQASLTVCVWPVGIWGTCLLNNSTSTWLQC